METKIVKCFYCNLQEAIPSDTESYRFGIIHLLFGLYSHERCHNNALAKNKSPYRKWFAIDQSNSRSNLWAKLRRYENNNPPTTTAQTTTTIPKPTKRNKR
jgi:hypothetical protein